MTKIIGITGGIGTGKSTVSACLREKGYIVLDADKMAKEVSLKKEVLEEVKQCFGTDFVVDGSMNRKKIADEIFSNQRKKILLESIITDRVKSMAEKKFQELKISGQKEIIFFDAPTLIESGAADLVDEILLVTAERDARIARVLERDTCSEEDVVKKIDNQMPDDEKKKMAHYIIDNSGNLIDLYKKIEIFLENII